MPKYYVGITIGPIIETLCMASRPASLWCASAMFSWLSEDICKKAIGIDGTVISPYYPKENKDIPYSVTEGVGKYHDRIIFTAEAGNTDSLKTKVAEMVETAKKSLATELTKPFKNDEKQTLQDVILNYLQVHYVIVDEAEVKGKNCILALSPYLDALELCPTFAIDQSIQPIMTLFEGKDDETHNELVKQCFNLKNNKSVVRDALNKEGKKVKQVRNIESIANAVPSSDRKIFDYYAVVQADGDSMGKLLETLKTDADVRGFSEICLNYTTAAASKINEFGGMTIYAGGDDLLFISPLENTKGETIFKLLDDISGTFHQSFSEYPGKAPTLSFGVSVNYTKFPLYEAFGDALNLLYTAKATDGDVKNKTAVRIRKHSGQSLQFRYLNQGVIYTQLTELLTVQTDAVFLHSMLYKISLYRPILIAALKQNRDLQETFKNLFDSEYHGTVSTYIDKVMKTLAVVYAEVKENNDKDYALKDIHRSQSESNNDLEIEENSTEYKSKKVQADEEIAIDVLCSMLRTARFFTEKKGEK